MNIKHKMIVAAAALVIGLDVRAAGTDPVTGEGTWHISGDTLTIESGNLSFVAPPPGEVKNIDVLEGASLKQEIDIDALFPNAPVMRIWGTWDLNGHVVNVLNIDNRKGNTIRSCSATIKNSSTQGASLNLTTTANAYFYGTIKEMPGKIGMTAGNTIAFLYGPENGMSLSAITNPSTAQASSAVMPLSAPTELKFVFKAPTDGSKTIWLSEISPTYKGVPVPVASATATSNPGECWALTDAKSDTKWKAAETGDQTVSIRFSSETLARVDGYRITPSDGESKVHRPSGWDVYVYRSDDVGWLLVDSRRDIQWPNLRDNTSLPNYEFSSEGKVGSPFGCQTSVALESKSEKALRVSNSDPLVVGKVTGVGGIMIENGGALEPGNLNEFGGQISSSTDNRLDLRGQVRLTSRGGTEQKVPVKTGQNIEVVNADTEVISVLLDDSTRQFGRLADGEQGQLGLVKRGGGEAFVETEAADYTGPTKVEEGTLVVARKRLSFSSMTAKYLRFTPIKTYGVNGQFPWAANEIQLLDDQGRAIPWPSDVQVTKPEGNTGSEHSTSKLLRFADNQTTTRALVPPYTDSTSGYVPLTIELMSPVTFNGYAWYSTRDNETDKVRTPVEWVLEVSQDKKEWVTVSLLKEGFTSEEEEDKSWSPGKEGYRRGGYAMTGEAVAESSGLHTLPSEFLTCDAPDRATKGVLTARYFRFQVYDIANPTRDEYSYGWQLAEIGLMKNGERVNWPASVSIDVTGGSVNAYNNSRKENLVNNVIWESGKGKDGNTRESAFIMEYPSQVMIDAGQTMQFDAYSLVGLTEYWQRMPKAWNFQISNDGITWTRIDSKGDYVLSPEARAQGDGYPEMGPFDMASKYPLLDRGAGDSLGDSSPVSIAEGAMLRLATDYERFGSLSGKGALELTLGAVADVNTCSSGAIFEGEVTGNGTLVLSGAGSQKFADADLTGVNTLEFDGGMFEGSAKFGALTVRGTPKLKLPDGVETKTYTFMTADAIDTDSQALLRSAEIVRPSGMRKRWMTEVLVDGTSVSVKVSSLGLAILFR